MSRSRERNQSGREGVVRQLARRVSRNNAFSRKKKKIFISSIYIYIYQGNILLHPLRAKKKKKKKEERKIIFFDVDYHSRGEEKTREDFRVGCDEKRQ